MISRLQFLEDQDPKMIFIFGVTVVLTGLIIFFLSLIIISKISRTRDRRLKRKYWPYIKEHLAMIAIQSVVNEGVKYDYRRSLRFLMQIRNRSRKIAQWVLDEIMKQKANLTGEANKTMLKVYRDLNLKTYSLRKLKSFNSNTVARGIYELESMEQRDVFSKFYKFLGSKNTDLRMAARLGLTSLAPNPLSFLDHLKEELSEWEQMSIYNRLRSKHKDQLPDFSKFYYHEQPSAVAFCVEMTVRFNYFELIPQLIELLKTTKNRSMVIDALKELEAFQALPYVKRLIHKSNNPQTIISCLNFLAHIGDESCRSIFETFIEHKNFEVRMAAVGMAAKLNIEFESSSEELESMLLHHQNELIS